MRCKSYQLQQEENNIRTHMMTTQKLDPGYRTAYEGTEEKTDNVENLYPNCDTSVWLRTCTDEVKEPLNGTVTGTIPKWLKGTLLRNGPGAMKIGDTEFEHLFDYSALMHRFQIFGGEVTYQCRFLNSETYKKNKAANRIVVTEFGTKAVPDVCQSIFSRVAALFKPGENMSDNAMISIYPFGDEFYAFTESPVIHRIDPITLETLERVDVSRYVNIVNHTSHPHVTKSGQVYNLGQSITPKGVNYSIVKFPCSEKNEADKHSCIEGQSLKAVQIVCSTASRWRLHPSYMHTFGITDNYYVIVEQPLSVSVPKVLVNTIFDEPMIGNLQWFGTEKTEIRLLHKSKAQEVIFFTEPFFFLHIINQYEVDNHVVLDICCYKDASMINCMYVEALKNTQTNPDYANMFRSRPKRFVLPLNLPRDSKEENLVILQNSHAEAYTLPNGEIYVKPETLCDIGCETPRIYYENYMGKFYRYFYAISSDVDSENPGTIIKVDTVTRTCKTWSEINAYPSEPIFVARPDAMKEDDGVLLSVLIYGNGNENKVVMLVLDAITMTEVGRATFNTPSPVPKCLHGWFAKDLV